MTGNTDRQTDRPSERERDIEKEGEKEKELVQTTQNCVTSMQMKAAQEVRLRPVDNGELKDDDEGGGRRR